MNDLSTRNIVLNDLNVVNVLAEMYIHLKEYQNAEDLLELVIEMQKSQNNQVPIDLVVNHAISLIHLNKLEVARQEINILLEQDVWAHCDLIQQAAEHLLDSRQFELAIKCLEVLEAPASQLTDLCPIYAKLALAHESLGSIAKAVSYYEKILQLNSNDYEARIALSSLYTKIGQPQHALAVVSQSIPIPPGQSASFHRPASSSAGEHATIQASTPPASSSAQLTSLAVPEGNFEAAAEPFVDSYSSLPEKKNVININPAMAVQMQKALLLLELHKSAEFLQTALPITDYFLSQQFLLQTQRKLKKRKRKSVVPQASETVRETPEQTEPSATSEETIFMFGPTTGKHAPEQEQQFKQLSIATFLRFFVSVARTLAETNRRLEAEELIEKFNQRVLSVLEGRPRQLLDELDFIRVGLAFEQGNYSSAFEIIIPLCGRHYKQLNLWRLFFKLMHRLSTDQVGNGTKLLHRLLARHPEDRFLQIINAHSNSLIAKYSKFQLSLYLNIYEHYAEDPLVNLCTGVRYLTTLVPREIRAREDLFERRTHLLRGFAFLYKYLALCQTLEDKMEALYNLGRAYQTMGLCHFGYHYYQQVIKKVTDALSLDSVHSNNGLQSSSVCNPSLGVERKREQAFHLKETAHNLALMYTNSGNISLANSILRRFMTV